MYISAFYLFTPLDSENLSRLKTDIEALAEKNKMRGLFLLGVEGINATVSATSKEDLENFKNAISLLFAPKDSGAEHQKIPFKDSVGERHPFRVFKVKIKKEIVTLGRTDLVPPSNTYRHLNPDEWAEALKDPNVVVLDTRNDYEFEIGHFKNAKQLDIKEFHDFPDKLANAGLKSEQKVLIYCTGGIRCEKAILAMEKQGFKDVYQLDGGILNYLEQRPNEDFVGECFVFDYRVAVDQQLQPTKKYRLCPHCGQPGNQVIQCKMCERSETICHRCFDQGVNTCSKNCAHHQSLGQTSTKPHLQEIRKRQPN